EGPHRNPAPPVGSRTRMPPGPRTRAPPRPTHDAAMARLFIRLGRGCAACPEVSNHKRKAAATNESAGWEKIARPGDFLRALRTVNATLPNPHEAPNPRCRDRRSRTDRIFNGLPHSLGIDVRARPARDHPDDRDRARPPLTRRRGHGAPGLRVP